MKTVLQRVSKASVRVDGEVVGSVDGGFLVLLGVGHGDTNEDIDYLVRKIVGMRVFSDADGKFNLSIKDIGGSLLVVSQFTLFADTKKGNRPSFISAAAPDVAKKLYEEFCEACFAEGVRVERGVFGAMMEVELTNDGPVTIVIDSKERGAAAKAG